MAILLGSVFSIMAVRKSQSADEGTLRQRLFNEILAARQRVYAAAAPTPLDRVGIDLPFEIYIKREDLSPIKAYKWRGAYNCMAQLPAAAARRGVVAASAGNHAQGVALAANLLGINAVIHMPRSTPRVKVDAVHRIGGNHVTVHLDGDTYNDSYTAASRTAAKRRMTIIHPFDDLNVMGGQGTIADEVVMSGIGQFDAAYLQIGGGGMAAAVACWLKHYYPSIRIVGVEGVDQASMQAAISRGKPVTLESVDVFCDGTAVSRAGALTYPLCASLIDRFITVTNAEVCGAIQTLWETLRVIPEPAGAMGLAGILKEQHKLKGKRVLCVLCGANMDFGQLALIARQAGIGNKCRRYLRIAISEKIGSMLHLLTTCFAGINIIDFQYGRVSPDIGWPVIGVETDDQQFRDLTSRIRNAGISCEEITAQTDVDFRVIPFNTHIIENPLFVQLEFHERAGALREFLNTIKQEHGSLCYFNYTATGERVGRALLGFTFDSAAHRKRFKQQLQSHGSGYRSLTPVALGVLQRIMAGSQTASE